MDQSDKLLLTGATGFVGSALMQRIFSDNKYLLRIAARKSCVVAPESAQIVQVSDLTNATDWTDALQGVDVVIHSAARVHVMNEGSSDPLEEYRKVNVEGTRALVQQAAQAGVKRFVFVSSIKVNGESTTGRQPYGAGLAG